MPDMSDTMFDLKERKNCWRRSCIVKDGSILSGQDSFLASCQVLSQVWRSVYILPWDIKKSINESVGKDMTTFIQ
jgi:hypothetical protein